MGLVIVDEKDYSDLSRDQMLDEVERLEQQIARLVTVGEGSDPESMAAAMSLAGLQSQRCTLLSLITDGREAAKWSAEARDWSHRQVQASRRLADDRVRRLWEQMQALESDLAAFDALDEG